MFGNAKTTMLKIILFIVETKVSPIEPRLPEIDSILWIWSPADERRDILFPEYSRGWAINYHLRLTKVPSLKATASINKTAEPPNIICGA